MTFGQTWIHDPDTAEQREHRRTSGLSSNPLDVLMRQEELLLGSSLDIHYKTIIATLKHGGGSLMVWNSSSSLQPNCDPLTAVKSNERIRKVFWSNLCLNLSNIWFCNLKQSLILTKLLTLYGKHESNSSLLTQQVLCI